MRIIPRAEWGARHEDGFRSAPLPASEVWLHHSVTIAPDLVAPFDDDYAAIRTLEQIGETRFGRGISYTWVITPAGLVFEGHGVGRQGAHTGGRNTIARAICLVGNYDTAKPTDAQIQAAAWLLRHARQAGWIQVAQLNGGHRQAPGASTACPGRHGMAAIPTINQLAAGGPIEEDDMDAEAKQWLREIYASQSQPTLQRGVDVGDVLVGLHDTNERVERIEATLAELAARPAGDVDEAALAAELDARGIGGVSAAELVEILSTVRLAPATSEGDDS